MSRDEIRHIDSIDYDGDASIPSLFGIGLLDSFSKSARVRWRLRVEGMGVRVTR